MTTRLKALSSPNWLAKAFMASTKEPAWSDIMIPLPEYAKIKDNYCVAYNGHCRDYVVLLRVLRPFIEREFPGIRIHLCCRDDHMYVLSGQDNVLPYSELHSRRSGFAYVRELLAANGCHPVESLVDESAIPIGRASQQPRPTRGSCLVVPHGMHPTRSLSGAQTRSLIEMARSRGFTPSTEIGWREADWVVGVESEQLFEAAAAGKATTLVNTGFGKNLYSRVFPDGQIIDPP